jgi:hypothetical protein
MASHIAWPLVRGGSSSATISVARRVAMLRRSDAFQSLCCCSDRHVLNRFRFRVKKREVDADVDA